MSTHPIFHQPITDTAGAKRLLRYLYAHGLTYHCEDNANDCLEGKVTREEGDALNARMNEAYEQEWADFECPCGYALRIDPAYTEELGWRFAEGEDEDLELEQRLRNEIDAEKATDNAANTSTYARALTATAQSILCHPDWDAETHLAYLQSEEGLDLDEPITRATWPNGPQTFPLRDYVANWVKYPAKAIEAARKL